MLKTMCVYIMTSKNDGPLYIGVTSDLCRRIAEHKHGLSNGFSKKYHVDKLVYFETCEDPVAAIAREKQLKNWHRDWKLNLVHKINPEMRDLTDEIMG